jgi:hypothetical protein
MAQRYTCGVTPRVSPLREPPGHPSWAGHHKYTTCVKDSGANHRNRLHGLRPGVFCGTLSGDSVRQAWTANPCEPGTGARRDRLMGSGVPSPSCRCRMESTGRKGLGAARDAAQRQKRCEMRSSFLAPYVTPASHFCHTSATTRCLRQAIVVSAVAEPRLAIRFPLREGTTCPQSPRCSDAEASSREPGRYRCCPGTSWLWQALCCSLSC